MPVLLVCLISMFLWGSSARAEAPSDRPFAAYRSGDIKKARRLYRKELARVLRSGTAKDKWASLFRNAWFEQEVGDHPQALEMSNRALVHARSLKDPYRMGRTLSWIGWCHANMGYYTLAIEFYERAIELGAPQGKISLVGVWGLATQELGLVYLRMGDLAAARKKLEETTGFARRHGVLTGVAEGAAHLAELHLVEGNLGKAKLLAEEAVQAAIGCDCSPNNIARARVRLAQVILAQALIDPGLLADAKNVIHAALSHAKESGNRRYVAKGQLLLAKALSDEEHIQKLKLVSSALEMLAQNQSDLAPTAEAHLGRVYLEQKQTKLARFYLQNGLRLNDELFRHIGSAYVVADIAHLEGLESKDKAYLETLSESADRAMGSGALALAARSQEELSGAFFERGFHRLSIRWTELALSSLGKMIDKEVDPRLQSLLTKRQVQLSQRLLELRLALSPEATRGPN